jgi:hypothetical protein
MSVYEIRVKGHLDPRWSEWFDGLEITNLENGEALLSGEIVDQAALHGVLAKVRDLGLPLVAVSVLTAWMAVLNLRSRRPAAAVHHAFEPPAAWVAGSHTGKP